MKNQILSTVLFVFCAFSTAAFAGPGGSGVGGGGVHVCPAKGTVEMYDLHEGRARYGIRYFNWPADTHVLSIANHAIGNLAEVNLTLAREVGVYFEHLLRQRNQRILRGEKIRKVDDAGKLSVDEGCFYDQLGVWDGETETLDIQGEYLDRLSSFDLAAFYVHESFYRAIRKRYAVKMENSEEVRRTVAELFGRDLGLTHVPLLQNKYDRLLPHAFNLRHDLLSDQSYVRGFWTTPVAENGRSIILNMGPITATGYESSYPRVELRMETLSAQTGWEAAYRTEFSPDSNCDFDRSFSAVKTLNLSAPDCGSFMLDVAMKRNIGAGASANSGKAKTRITARVTLLPGITRDFSTVVGFEGDSSTRFILTYPQYWTAKRNASREKGARQHQVDQSLSKAKRQREFDRRSPNGSDETPKKTD